MRGFTRFACPRLSSTFQRGESDAGCTARTATSPPPRSLPRIAVVVRKRPLNEAERKRNEADLVQTRGRNAVLVDEPREKVDLTPYVMRHEFRVDFAFDEKSTNAEVYRAVVRPLVEACCLGDANTSCFAYGQTGSGKTYTMLGPQPYGRGVEAGVFELAAEDIFKCLEGGEKDAFVSFFEIYNGKLFDLLQNRKLVAALENGKKEVVVRDLRMEQVRDKEALLSKMIEGIELRKIGVNSVNDESSRSHAILQVLFRKRNSGEACGRVAFIDLAGSERGADTLQHSRQTQQDGAGINRSLLALKECIRAMDQDKGHIPFRDSELTKVLREIFVGRSSRSVMIATVSPSTSCCEQTLNTLRYASRVKNFRQTPPQPTAVVPASSPLPPRPSSSTAESSSFAFSRSISSANAAARQTRASLPCMHAASSDGLGTVAEKPPKSGVDEPHLGALGESPTPHLAETAQALSPLEAGSPSRVSAKSARAKGEGLGRAGSATGPRAQGPTRSRARPETVLARSSLEKLREEASGPGDARPETDAETQANGPAGLASGADLQRDRSSLSASTCAPSSCERLSSCGSAQTGQRRAASVRASRPATSHASPQLVERRSGEPQSAEDAEPSGERDKRHRGASSGGSVARPVTGAGASLRTGRGLARLHASSGSSEECRSSQDLDAEEGEVESGSAFLATRSTSRKLATGSRAAPERASLLPRLRGTRAACASPLGVSRTSLGAASPAPSLSDSTVADVEPLGFGSEPKTTRGRGGEAFEISLGSDGGRKKGALRAVLRKAEESSSEATPRSEGLSATRLYKTTRLLGAPVARSRGLRSATAGVEPSARGVREKRSSDVEKGDSSSSEKDASAPGKARGGGRPGAASTPPLSLLRKSWLRANHEQQAQHGALVCPDGSSIIFVPRHGRAREASPLSPREKKTTATALARSLGSNSSPEDADMPERPDGGLGLSKKRREDEGEACGDARRDQRLGDAAPRGARVTVSPYLVDKEEELRPASAALPPRAAAFPSKLPRPSPGAHAPGLSLDAGLGGDREKIKSPVAVALDASSQRLLAHLLPRSGFRGATLASPRRATEQGTAAAGDRGEASADAPALVKRKKQGEENARDACVAEPAKGSAGEERIHFGCGREPQTILQEAFACNADYHNLDLAELDRLQDAVADRRATCMQQLLQLAKKRAEEASSRHGINESQQDILVCRLHQANPGSSEFGEYMRQRMEADFRKLLAMRQLWVEAEELRMLNRLLTSEYQTKSGAARAPAPGGALPEAGLSPSSRRLGAGHGDSVSPSFWKKPDLETARDVEMTEAFPSPPLLSGCSPVAESGISA
ncbi:UNVERIFIED_CONTAM: internal kinesin motor domain protein [Hammondia hammondi]|eukprot:XP_008884073.1 internal kinesin motor domain protein [Hammondia hammondi]